jgi:hypothetical protein
MRDADPTSQAAVERAALARARANNPDQDARDIRLGLGGYQSRISRGLEQAAADAAYQARIDNGQQMTAWDGVNRDPYARTRAGMELMLIGPIAAPAVSMVSYAAAPVVVPLGLRATLVGGITGFSVHGAFQMASDDLYKPAEGINAAITGATSFGKGVPVSAAINMGGAYVTAKYQGDDPGPKVVGALVGTIAGAQVGDFAAKQALQMGVAAAIRGQSASVVGPLVSQTGRDLANGTSSSVAQESSGKAVDEAYKVYQSKVSKR